MELIRFGDVREFLDAAMEYLVAREAEHNLILGVAGFLRDQPDAFSAPAYLAVVMDGPAVVLTAMQTPPFGLIVSETADPDAIGLLVTDLARSRPDLRGVVGPTGPAGEFVRRWTESTGRAARLERAERIYRLSSVVPPPRMAPGAWRRAGPGDRRLLVDWLAAFHDEAVPDDPQPGDPDAVAGRWIAGAGRVMYLWTVQDRVVSMVGAGSPTPHGIRIAPVYTPPEDRGNGYASALTAAASQDQLDAGRTQCFLYTDLANPTSNHIYQAIGYQPVEDVNQYVFVDPECATAPSHLDP